MKSEEMNCMTTEGKISMQADVVVWERVVASHQVVCILYFYWWTVLKFRPDILESQVWPCDTSSWRLGQHVKANIFFNKCSA